MQSRIICITASNWAKTQNETHSTTGLLENIIFADRTCGYGAIKHNPNKQPLDPLTTTSEMDFSDGADQINRLYSTKCKFLIDPSVSQEAH